MRRPLKFLAWSFGTAVLLAVVLGGAVLVAGNTDAGRGLIERLTFRLTSGYVKLTGLGGSFPTQLTLQELQLIDRGGVWLTANSISLRWSPLRLLDRRIQVDTLHVARLDMERAPLGSGHGGAVTIPYIEVGQFSGDAVTLGAALTGTAVTLSLQGHVRLRSLEDANADVVARRLNGDGEYTVHLRFDPKTLDASLAVHEPASGPLENLLSLPGLGALSATATLRGPHDAGLLDLALAAGDLHARVQGSVDLTQRAAQLTFALTAPAMSPRPDLVWGGLKLQGSWHGSLTAPTADGVLDVERVTFAGTTQASSLTANLSAARGRIGLHSVVNGLVIPGPQARFFAKAPLRLDGSLQLDQVSRPFDLTATHPLFALHAHGATHGDDSHPLAIEVDLRLPDVAPYALLADQDVRGTAVIGAHLTHRSTDNTLTADGDVRLTGGSAAWIRVVEPRLALQLSADLTADSVNLKSARIAGRTATLTASGSAVRATEPRDAAAFLKSIQARWQLDLSNLAAVSSDIAGTVRVSGRLSGTPKSLAADAEATSQLSVRGSPSGTVEATLHARGLPSMPSGTAQVHGMLDGAPLNVDAMAARGAANAVHILIHRADWKSAHADGDVTVDAALTQSHGQLQLRIAQLADLDRLLGIELSGSVEGTAGFIPSAGHTAARLDLEGKSLVYGQFAGDMHLHAQGVSDSLALTVKADLPSLYGTPADLTAAALLNIDKQQLRLTSAALDYRGGKVRLVKPSLLTFAGGFSVDDLQVQAQDAILELQGELAPALDVRASLRQVKPTLINVFSPGLLADGALDARARLRGTLSSPTGSLHLDASGIRFADDAALGLPALDLHARAELANGTAAVNGTLAAGAASQLTVSGSAPLGADGNLDLKIGGKLDVGMANPLLEARGMHAAGRLTVDATVTGSVAAPQVGGGITLAQGSVRDYGRGVNLSDIRAEVVGHEGALQIKSFNATAETGSIAMTGSIGVLQSGLPLDLKITAKNAQPIASNIVTANLGADLQVSGKARERLDVSGTIHVNRATIDIPNSLPPDVAVLDVRRRGRAAPTPNDKQLVIGLDIALNAPQQIIVEGRGLNAELGGDIHLSGTTDAPIASGGFDLQRGSFTLSGNKLSFTQGRVSFDGTGLQKKIDPTLDFTAQTTLSDSTATLRITGVADAPRFEFSSSPPLPQDEIMARLLFGQSAASLTALQAAEIGAALATLTGVGGTSFLTKVQKTLGLDRLSVGSNTTQTVTGTENSGAAIEAGRYVTKRVYIEGRQSTTGNSQVQVDVDLTKHLKLQTRLGNGTAITQGTTPENDPGSSIGLSYQFEY